MGQVVARHAAPKYPTGRGASDPWGNNNNIFMIPVEGRKETTFYRKLL
jgi:hypothetical protein